MCVCVLFITGMCLCSSHFFVYIVSQTIIGVVCVFGGEGLTWTLQSEPVFKITQWLQLSSLESITKQTMHLKWLSEVMFMLVGGG